MNKIDFYIRLRSIIQKIIHRCNPSEYNNFDELLLDINGTVFDEDHGSTFLTNDDIDWIQSDFEIKENIIRLCRDAQIEENVDSVNGTVQMLLIELDMVYQPKVEILNLSLDFKNLAYLQDHTTELCDFMDSQLLLNDLSILPYKKQSNKGTP
jgi:hypothetical protein